MSVCAHENMSMIAVGFQNGTVILIRGNITRDRMSRVRVVHEEKGERVYVTGTHKTYCAAEKIVWGGGQIYVTCTYTYPCTMYNIFDSIWVAWDMW